MGRSPIRTCAACRQRRDPGELVRLRLDGDGGWTVGPGPGRGTWVCPDPTCLARLTRTRGGRQARARRSVSDDEPLRVVRTAVRALMEQAVRRCSERGLVVSGAMRVRVCLERRECAAILLSCDATPRGEERLACWQVPVLRLPFDRVALGRLAGRAPRSKLAVRSGEGTEGLVQVLHRGVRLG